MATRRTQIQIDTRADVSGANQTATAVKKVGEESEKASRKSESAAQKAAAAEERAARKAEERAAREAAAKEKAAQRAMAAQKAEADAWIRNEAKQNELAQRRIQARERGAGGGSGSYRMGGVALQAQDILVQAQMGTAATTILAQQGSQIAGIFGPKGAVIGAVVAGVAIAGKAIFNLATATDVFDKLKESGEELAATMTKIGEAAGKRDVAQLVNYMADLADNLAAVHGEEMRSLETRKALAGATDATADATAAANEAAIKYLGTTGQIRDAEGALASLRQQEAQREKQQATEAQQAEAQRATIARKQAEERTAQLAANLEALRMNLANAQAERDAAIQSREGGRMVDRAAAVGRQGVLSALAGQAPIVTAGAQTLAAGQKIAEQDAKIEQIRKEGEDVKKALEDAVRAQEAAASAEQAAITTATANIQAITAQFESAQTVETLATATETMQTAATEITTEVAKFQPITIQQQQAKDAIMQAAADGKITAEETLTVARSLQTLQNTATAAQKEQLTAIQGLIQLNQTLISQIQAANREIQKMKASGAAIQPIR